jgi:hypothetical protein
MVRTARSTGNDTQQIRGERFLFTDCHVKLLLQDKITIK